jgi:hypothetical protein
MHIALLHECAEARMRPVHPVLALLDNPRNDLALLIGALEVLGKQISVECPPIALAACEQVALGDNAPRDQELECFPGVTEVGPFRAD